MEKNNFSTTQVMVAMAALKIIIKSLADTQKDNKAELSTDAVAAFYGLSPQELGYYLGDACFADLGDDGRMYFLPKYDPSEMGSFDEKRKTFLWSAKGLGRVLSVMAEAGVYPGDLLIQPFLGNKAPEKVIEEIYPEYFNNNKTEKDNENI